MESKCLLFALDHEPTNAPRRSDATCGSMICEQVLPFHGFATTKRSLTSHGAPVKGELKIRS